MIKVEIYYEKPLTAVCIGDGFPQFIHDDELEYFVSRIGNRSNYIGLKSRHPETGIAGGE